MNYDAHISKISHDGSGTVITAIDFERCPFNGPCHLCADGVAKIPVTIFAKLDASEARRA